MKTNSFLFFAALLLFQASALAHDLQSVNRQLRENHEEGWPAESISRDRQKTGAISDEELSCVKEQGQELVIALWRQGGAQMLAPAGWRVLEFRLSASRRLDVVKKKMILSIRYKNGLCEKLSADEIVSALGSSM